MVRVSAYSGLVEKPQKCERTGGNRLKVKFILAFFTGFPTNSQMAGGYFEWTRVHAMPSPLNNIDSKVNQKTNQMDGGGGEWYREKKMIIKMVRKQFD